MSHLTFGEAGVVGLIQGVTELFPLSSLGHNVLIPALIGGSWAQDLNVSSRESPYLAFIVGLHVATAIAMIIFFWRDWLRIIGAFFASLKHLAVPEPGTRRWQPQGTDQTLAWMIIIATIPVGLAGLKLEHIFRVALSKPIPTALFLALNGVILLGGELLRRRGAAAQVQQLAADEAAIASQRAPAATRQRASASIADRQGAAFGDDPRGAQVARDQVVTAAEYAFPGAPGAASAGGAVGTGGDGGAGGTGGYAGGRAPGGGRHATGQRALRQQEAGLAIQADRRLVRMGWLNALLLGVMQIAALCPGISRDGIVMVSGMFRGLTRQDAARFSFLLSAPVILAAGALKIGDLTGPLGDGIRGQVIFGSVLSGVGAYLALRFLVRYLSDSTKTLTPFGIYCLVAGIGSAIYLSVV